MPSTTSSSFCRPLPSSTVITPSLPTLSIASEMILPIASSALAEIAPTWAISLLVVQGFDNFFSSSTTAMRSEEHTSELQSLTNLVCRLLLEKKKNKDDAATGNENLEKKELKVQRDTRRAD